MHSFQTCFNQSKPLAFIPQAGLVCGKKSLEKGLKIPLMNCLNGRVIATLGTGKYNDGTGLLHETHRIYHQN